MGMNAIIGLLLLALDIYLWLIIFTVIVSWLVAFDVLNTRNRWVYLLCEWLNRLTNPVVQRVRRYVPPIGGIDLTPMVIIFGIWLLQTLLISLL
jgi:YggT family protein